MSNNIERIINEIEDYIDGCKFSPLSTSKILVNKEELEELLEELKLKTPDEIKKYQRMLANKNGILEDAKQRAENIIAEATEQASALVNDHEIMQQAFIQGNDLMTRTQEESNRIIAEANAEADSIRLGAIRYTDELLGSIQNTITYSMENITVRYEAYMKALQKTLELVIENRNELNVSSQPQPSYMRSQPAAQQAAEEEELPGENYDDYDEFEDYTVEMDGFSEEE